MTRHRALAVGMMGAVLLASCQTAPPPATAPPSPATARPAPAADASVTPPTTTAGRPGSAPTTVAPPTTVATSTTVATPTTVAPSTVMPPVAAGAGRTWAVAFSDDFNGSALDTTRWTPCFSWAQNTTNCTYSFNNGRERYQPGQVRLSGGIARLVAEPVPGGDGGSPAKTYRSGLLSTTNRPASSGQPGSLFSFRYGYAEARMKLPAQRGFFTAWWMLPPDPGSYDYAYEIDVLEHLGGGDPISHMTVHHTNRTSWWSANSNAPNGACPTFDPSQAFHTYGVDWQPASIAFYIDGTECGRFTGPVWNGDLELILNLMVDVDWQRQVGAGLVDPTLSASLDVDYVKVWQRR